MTTERRHSIVYLGKQSRAGRPPASAAQVT